MSTQPSSFKTLLGSFSAKSFPTQPKLSSSRPGIPESSFLKALKKKADTLESTEQADPLQTTSVGDPASLFSKLSQKPLSFPQPTQKEPEAQPEPPAASSVVEEVAEVDVHPSVPLEAHPEHTRPLSLTVEPPAVTTPAPTAKPLETPVACVTPTSVAPLFKPETPNQATPMFRDTSASIPHTAVNTQSVPLASQSPNQVLSQSQIILPRLSQSSQHNTLQEFCDVLIENSLSDNPAGRPVVSTHISVGQQEAVNIPPAPKWTPRPLPIRTTPMSIKQAIARMNRPESPPPAPARVQVRYLLEQRRAAPAGHSVSQFEDPAAGLLLDRPRKRVAVGGEDPVLDDSSRHSQSTGPSPLTFSRKKMRLIN